MKIQLALYFFILGTIQLGLIVGVYHYRENKDYLIKSQYWTVSLIINILAIFVFGFGIIFITNIQRPDLNFTIANVLFYFSSLLQMFFCISLNRVITKKEKIISLITSLIFIYLFDYLRRNSDFESRTILMCIVMSFFYIVQIRQLLLYKKDIQSKQINYLKYATTLELLAALTRIAIFLVPAAQIREVEQIPAILTVVTIFQLVMNTLSYIAIGGYWTEKIAISNYQFHIENERINQLLKEQNKLIYSLSVANKTAATGALAASIAHELNQPLGSSNINIQLLKLKLDSGHLDPELLEEILISLQNDNTRASTIIKSLRSIFLEEQIEYQNIRLDSLIESVLPIVRPEIEKAHINLEVELSCHPYIKCVPAQIKQIFLNLFNNAIYSLKKSNYSEKLIKLTVAMESSNLQIDFYDNGAGVSEENQKDLFELLSGSKKSGMGLGLWLSRHIVTHHGGTLEYLNAPYGALFRIKMHATA